MICIECGKILTEDEILFYEYRCESCEGVMHEEIERWRKGEESDELDSLYGGARHKLH